MIICLTNVATIAVIIATNLHILVILSKKKYYLESCVDFGFDYAVTDGVQKPLCIFCSKVLGNGSMKPPILKTHHASCQSSHIHNTHESLHANPARSRAGKTRISFEFTTENISALKASNLVALKTAKKKSRTLLLNDLSSFVARIWLNFCVGKKQQKFKKYHHQMIP